MWLVIDGDILYLDRNGNGDLTEDGERLVVNFVNRELASPMISEGHHFVDLLDPSKSPFSDEDRDVPALSGTTRYSRFALDFFVLNKTYQPRTPEEIQTAKNLARYLEGYVDVKIMVDRKFVQRGRARFASRASEAPILHFDGPMTFEFYDPDQAKPRLVPGKSSALNVRVATRGLGKGTVTYLEYGTIPQSLNPVAEIDYPGPTPGKTIKTKTALDFRAGSDGFRNVITVPEGAAAGTAKIRLTFPGLKGTDVAPAVLDVPVNR